MPPSVTPTQLYMSIAYYGFLIAFIAIYFGVFRRKGDVAFKRKWWPRFLALFVVFTALKIVFFLMRMPANVDRSQQLQFIMIFAVIGGMVFLRLRNSKFCDKCSSLVRGRMTKARASCPRCGTDLTQPQS